jgi:hypothetical protein
MYYRLLHCFLLLALVLGGMRVTIANIPATIAFTTDIGSIAGTVSLMPIKISSAIPAILAYPGCGSPWSILPLGTI